MSKKKHVRGLFFAVLLALILSVPFTAYAKTYVDENGGFSIEIPEGANIYYYTPTDTNMTGALLESAQAGSADTKLLIGAYNAENVLGYSMKVEVTAAEGEDPLAARLEGIREAQAEEYLFADAADTEAGGQPAKVLEGTSTKDPGYSTRITAFENKGSVVCVTVIYKNDDAAYLQQAEGVLGSMAFGEAATPPPVPTETPAPTEAAPAEPTAQPEATQTARATSRPIEEQDLQPMPQETAAGGLDLNGISWLGLSVKTLLMILAALVAAIIVVIVLIARNCRKHRKTKEMRLETGARSGRAGRKAAPETKKRKKGTRFKP
ncbi:hypothetical protein [Christensenella intestinihominis]|uniref:hypothetical protein n=1 Tax=Christensenella intestinihominis TaxID=1851429 RepID=UPI00082CEE1F|nr:hypothetical protein [Christensenella intestinihominis]